MQCATAGSTVPDAEEAVEQVSREVASQLDAPADLLFLFSSTGYPVERLNSRIRDEFEEARILGGTSCQGVMTEKGVFDEDDRGMGVLAFNDPDGAFGVGVEEIDGDARQTASRALKKALEDSGRIGEVPQLIWMTGESGHEEDAIAGIEDVVGPKVPIIGGSAADNDVAGQWKQFAHGEVYTNSVVVTVLFPSSSIGYSFHSGYEPTSKRGTVTRAEGRILYEIDGKLAAEVYNGWTDGAIREDLNEGGTVLEKTTLHPLGRKVGTISDTPYYRLSHPEGVTEDGALKLFSRIEEGDEVVCMTGTVDLLTSRAGRVATAARQTMFSGDETLAGALVTYCAGCMLAVQDRSYEVVEGLNAALDDRPFLGTFTFGEQGCFVEEGNRHANLMISVVTFYR